MKNWMLAALALVSAAPSYADNAAMDRDVTCLVSLALLPGLNEQKHSIDDAQATQMALIGSMFYIGKISGRDPNYDVEGAVVRLAESIDNATVGQALVRCGGELEAQGGRWETIGKHLMDKARKS